MIAGASRFKKGFLSLMAVSALAGSAFAYDCVDASYFINGFESYTGETVTSLNAEDITVSGTDYLNIAANGTQGYYYIAYDSSNIVFGNWDVQNDITLKLKDTLYAHFLVSDMSLIFNSDKGANCIFEHTVIENNVTITNTIADVELLSQISNLESTVSNLESTNDTLTSTNETYKTVLETVAPAGETWNVDTGLFETIEIYDRNFSNDGFNNAICTTGQLVPARGDYESGAECLSLCSNIDINTTDENNLSVNYTTGQVRDILGNCIATPQNSKFYIHQNGVVVFDYMKGKVGKEKYYNSYKKYPNSDGTVDIYTSTGFKFKMNPLYENNTTYADYNFVDDKKAKLKGYEEFENNDFKANLYHTLKTGKFYTKGYITAKDSLFPKINSIYDTWQSAEYNSTKKKFSSAGLTYQLKEKINKKLLKQFKYKDSSGIEVQAYTERGDFNIKKLYFKDTYKEDTISQNLNLN